MKTATAHTSYPEILQQLRSLRLSGAGDALDIRIRQATDQQLSHLEFLQLLLSDELARREQSRLALLLKNAGMSSSKTSQTFDFNATPSINRSLVSDLLTCRFMTDASPVLICGPTGTGKSHLAQAIGHQAIRQGKTVIFASQKGLLGQLHKARITGAYDRKFARLVKADLLIVDDYGLYPMASPQDEDFHELIDHRYEQRSVIITSNLEFGEWDQAFARNKLLATATLDRLLHNAYRLTLQGQSYRRPKDMKKETVARTSK